MDAAQRLLADEPFECFDSKSELARGKRAATTTQLVAAALCVAPVVVIGGAQGMTHLASADRAHLIAAVATGLLGGAVPFLAFNHAIRNLTVAHAGLILNLIAVLAAGGAVVALGERLHWPEVVGGMLVVAAATASASLAEPLNRAADDPCMSHGASVVG